MNKKHKPPSSSDSELHALRERLFQRPTILATPTQLTTTPTTPSVRGKEDSAAGAPSEASSNFFKFSLYVCLFVCVCVGCGVCVCVCIVVFQNKVALNHCNVCSSCSIWVPMAWSVIL